MNCRLAMRAGETDHESRGAASDRLPTSESFTARVREGRPAYRLALAGSKPIHVTCWSRSLEALSRRSASRSLACVKDVVRR